MKFIELSEEKGKLLVELVIADLGNLVITENGDKRFLYEGDYYKEVCVTNIDNVTNLRVIKRLDIDSGYKIEKFTPLNRIIIGISEDKISYLFYKNRQDNIDRFLNET